MEFSDVEKSLSSLNKDKKETKDLILNLIKQGIEKNGELIEKCFDNGMQFFDQDDYKISNNQGKIGLFDTPQRNKQDAPVMYDIKNKNIFAIVKDRSFQDVNYSITDEELKNMLLIPENFKNTAYLFISTDKMILHSIKLMKDDLQRSKRQVVESANDILPDDEK